MASSSNNITFVHFSLIFFVMLAVILGVVSYLQINDAAEQRTKATNATKEKDRLTKERDNFADAYRALADKAGYPERLDKDGKDQDASDKPLARMTADLELLGDKTSNVKDRAIRKMKLAADKDVEIATKVKQITKEQTDHQQALQKEQQNAVAARNDLTSKNQELTTLKQQYQADLDGQRAQIAQLQAEKRSLQQQMTLKEEQHKQALQDLNKKIGDLENTVALKQTIIDKLLNVSFERPDGLVRWIDHRTNLVWINLGSEDNLPERMTFSVYKKKHNGIARDSDHQNKLKELMERDTGNMRNVSKLQSDDIGGTQSDIKGAIEVTRIVGPHLAEARVLKNDLYDPIRAGDPIYTPLWSPGVEESFSFAIYLDGTKFSGLDQDLLFRMVKSAGATISNYMDKNGNIVGKGITEKDKFLVITDVPDPRGTADPKQRKIREAMAATHLKLQQQARRAGVRIVRLADFLNYIGYKPDRRLWRPGDQSKRMLKAGAHSTSVNETVGRRASSGQTSGIFTKRGRLKQPKSSGQTSKVFGGSRGY